MPQTEQQKIRSRLRGYERKLQQEKKKYGYCSDGGGRRYHIAPHYMLLGDNEGALTAFVSFDEEFDDDAGTPDFWLCYSLALHRADNEVGAAKRLRQAMMSNLYLLPHLIGDPIAALDIWHGSSYAEPGYIDHIAEHYLQLWTDEEKEWASGLYHSPGFRTARERYVEISKLLKTVPRGPERSRLVAEMSDLKYG